MKLFVAKLDRAGCDTPPVWMVTATYQIDELLITLKRQYGTRIDALTIGQIADLHDGKIVTLRSNTITDCSLIVRGVETDRAADEPLRLF